MTTQSSAGPVQYELEPPPAGGLEGVKSWAFEMLGRLVQLQQQPRVQSVMVARVEAIADMVFQRPADGMLIYAAANVVAAGKPAGLYFYTGGAWKQVSLL